MAPLLVLLQAHLCGERRLAVGTAVTQLLSYGGLLGTETSGEGVKLPPSAKHTNHTHKKVSRRLLPFLSTDQKRM